LETSKQFDISAIGDETGAHFSGTFKVRTILSRRDQFVADQRRRSILGADAQSAMPGLIGEAFMLSQLYVRIIEAPKWWQDSDGGLELKDPNIISQLFDSTMKAVESAKQELLKEADEAKAKLK
jgi:hypothetical protein